MLIDSMLSHYKVLRKLGSGGMGEVYLAQDTTLGRQVALKIVLPEVAADPGRRTRFEAEARAVAALNHPNIVTVHSIERSGDVHFITMEYVTGKPLSAAIPGAGLPVGRFLELAIPLAEAVGAAHQQGVTHRDLKPDNVMITDDGRIKVLDFGLAKLKPALDENAETVLNASPAVTTEGQVLGTVAYMSPEQAEGKALDHRSDIFSLGILLFEMATGRRPFRGDSAASILSAILRDDPAPVSQLNPALPPQLASVIQRCLVKDPQRRYQSALDIRNELAELKRTVDSGVGGPADTGRRGGSRWLFASLAAAGALAMAAILWLGGDRTGDDTEAIGDVAFTQLTHGAGQELFPSLSPDGRTVIYASAAAGNMDIYSLRVGGQNPVNLTGDSTVDESQPAFSADGERVAFRSERDGGGIFMMGATGESVRRLTNAGYHPSWSPDGQHVLYVTQSVTDPSMRFTTSQMWTVAIVTGQQRMLSEGDAAQPAWSPNGQRIAYWGRTANAGPGDIWTVPASGGTPVAVTTEASIDWNPVWAPDGRHLYFASDRGGSMNLWRVGIDEASGAVLGRAVPVTTGGAASQHITIAQDGRRLAYVSRVESTNVQKVAFDPAAGSIRGIPEWVTRGSRAVTQPDPSPDGRRLTFNTSGPQEDIFVAAADGSGLQQLTDDAFEDRSARWAPDGRRIAFYSDRTGKYEIWTINSDGSGLQQLTKSPGAHYPVWSPDGARMAYSTHAPNGAFIFEPAIPWNEQKPRQLPAIPDKTQTFEIWSWSPDGRRLAGQKHLTDLSHAGIAIHDVGSQQIRWLTDFGEWPVWLRDSRRLLFSHRGSLYLIDSAAGTPREVMALPQNSLGSVGLAADNRAIYFTLRASEADIWLMTLK